MGLRTPLFATTGISIGDGTHDDVVVVIVVTAVTTCSTTSLIHQ